MRRFLALLCAFVLLAAPARAGQAEAREAARLNNCPPKKIEIVQNLLGSTGKVVYQVSCNLPKMASAEGAKGGPDAVLIGCAQSLCELMRPVSSEKK